MSTRIGLLFDGREEGQRKALGSCSCLVDPGVLVTAAHCVDGIPPERIWINHHGGAGRELLSSAKRVELVREADLAVITTEVTTNAWVVRPFAFVKYGVSWGEEVCAVGWPVEHPQIGIAPNEPRFRFFRGYIHRPFIYETKKRGERYSAYELSFAAPHGLSGAPVFLADDLLTLIGVVTSNLEVFVERAGSTREINYGVATNIFAASTLLESILGRKLPVRHG